jgi:hypothetical protein
MCLRPALSLEGKMFATILTYLSLAYSFDLAYENTEWLLWDYANPEWYVQSDDYLGFRADLEFRAGIDELYGFIGGQMYNGSKIESLKDGPAGFNPVFDDYQFRAGARTKHVEIGYEYHCVHPIMTYLIDDKAMGWKKEGAYSKFYIKVSGKIGGKK